MYTIPANVYFSCPENNKNAAKTKPAAENRKISRIERRENRARPTKIAAEANGKPHCPSIPSTPFGLVIKYRKKELPKIAKKAASPIKANTSSNIAQSLISCAYSSFETILPSSLPMKKSAPKRALLDELPKQIVLFALCWSKAGRQGTCGLTCCQGSHTSRGTTPLSRISRGGESSRAGRQVGTWQSIASVGHNGQRAVACCRSGSNGNQASCRGNSYRRHIAGSRGRGIAKSIAIGVALRVARSQHVLHVNFCSRNSHQTFGHPGTHSVVLVGRQGHGSQNTDDRNHDHQFDQGKTLQNSTLHKSLPKEQVGMSTCRRISQA